MFLNEITTCIVEVYFVDFDDPSSKMLTNSENCSISGEHVVLHGQTAFFLCHWVGRRKMVQCIYTHTCSDNPGCCKYDPSLVCSS